MRRCRCLTKNRVPVNYLVGHSGLETGGDVGRVVHAVRGQGSGSVPVQAVAAVPALFGVESVVLFESGR